MQRQHLRNTLWLSIFLCTSFIPGVASEKRKEATETQRHREEVFNGTCRHVP
jgi:hypothetical protein